MRIVACMMMIVLLAGCGSMGRKGQEDRFAKTLAAQGFSSPTIKWEKEDKPRPNRGVSRGQLIMEAKVVVIGCIVELESATGRDYYLDEVEGDVGSRLDPMINQLQSSPPLSQVTSFLGRNRQSLPCVR